MCPRYLSSLFSIFTFDTDPHSCIYENIALDCKKISIDSINTYNNFDRLCNYFIYLSHSLGLSSHRSLLSKSKKNSNASCLRLITSMLVREFCITEKFYWRVAFSLKRTFADKRYLRLFLIGISR